MPDHGVAAPAFQRHCWPALPDVLARVRAVRAQWQAEHARGRRLARVYVLTNGERAWWEAVRGALRAEGWDVRGSGDMVFGGAGEGGGEGGARRAAERVVGQAVDMAVAVRAEVFIGNGVSGRFLSVGDECG